MNLPFIIAGLKIIHCGKFDSIIFHKKLNILILWNAIILIFFFENIIKR